MLTLRAYSIHCSSTVQFTPLTKFALVGHEIKSIYEQITLFVHIYLFIYLKVYLTLF